MPVLDGDLDPVDEVARFTVGVGDSFALTAFIDFHDPFNLLKSSTDFLMKNSPTFGKNSPTFDKNCKKLFTHY